MWLNSGNNTWPTEAIDDDNPFHGIDVGGSAAPVLQDINVAIEGVKGKGAKKGAALEKELAQLSNKFW